jgi:hypothetical protein
VPALSASALQSGTDQSRRNLNGRTYGEMNIGPSPTALVGLLAADSVARADFEVVDAYRQFCATMRLISMTAVTCDVEFFCRVLETSATGDDWALDIPCLQLLARYRFCCCKWLP